MPSQHVALLATGGTISAGPEGTLNAKSLIRLAASSAEGIPRNVPVRGADIASIPSSRVTAASIEQLASAIRASLADDGCRGVVVTHGTDTMEEVAFACDLLLGRTNKPVIFTGAMIPPRDRGTDAHINLAHSIRVAQSESPSLAGTFVVMRERIHAAIEVRKTHTASPDAFTSPALGPVGMITSDQIEVLRDAPKLSIATDHLEPDVELIRLAASSGDRLIRAASGARGVVIELFGAGNAPEPVHDAIRDAVAAGTVVLVTSRVGLGGLSPESGVIQAGAIPAIREPGGPAPTVLDGLKARALLMAALGAGLDAAGLRDLFGQSAVEDA